MSARVHNRVRRRQKPHEGFLAHLLDPIDTLTEIIFSVLILLTFTLAFRIFMMDGRPVTAEYVNELIWAALGATVAWGIIDGIMYILIEVLGRKMPKGARNPFLHQHQFRSTIRNRLTSVGRLL